MRRKKIIKKIPILFFSFLSFCYINTFSEETTFLNVESPIENHTITDTLEISGWKFSKEENTSIKVYIGDIEINDIKYETRPDVVKALNGNNYDAENPTPGFKINVDIKKIKDGKYPIIVQVINDKGDVIKSKKQFITIKKSNSLLNVENIDKQIKGNTLKISGWEMTDLREHNLVLYIDDNVIENASLSRIEREDVIKAIGGYGSKVENPTPGFQFVADMSNYKDGLHNISLKTINNNTGEVIQSKSHAVSLKKSQTILNIEEPVNNASVGKGLKISGWIMTSDTNNVLEVKIDGTKLKKEMITRIERPDVIKAISDCGGATANPTPGFFVDYDSSILSDANHTIRVAVINRNTNEVVSVAERSINVETDKTLLNIETPQKLNIEKGSITISGWMMSTNANQHIIIKVDDDEYIPMRIMREDVLEAIKNYGDKTENPTPGFEKVVDLRKYKDGKHYIIVEAYDKNTNKLLSQKQLEITLHKYKSLLNIETGEGTKAKTTLALEGWVVSTCNNYFIKLYIDNKAINDEVEKIAREDVNKAITGYGENAFPGFKSLLNLRSITDGFHTIKVEIVDKITEEVIIAKKISINVKKHSGLINIELPENDSIINGTNIDISGWIVSDMKDDEYIFKTLIDGQQIANTPIVNYEREDVNQAVTEYGYNSFPGFQTSVNVRNIRDGQHKLELNIINPRTNEVIAKKAQNVIIKKYNGIINVESPIKRIFNSDILISGWEMSNYPDARIVIEVDNNKTIGEITRLPRNDVISAITNYGTQEENSSPGFEYTLNFNNYAEGQHTISIKTVTDSNEIISETKFKVLFYRNVYFGIDISSWNGKIDFAAAKRDGLDFAIIRMGTSGYGSGRIIEDIFWKENIKNALKNNIKVGVYFLSNAINDAEIIEEANFIINSLNFSGYSNSIKYPVIFDTEFSAEYPNGRADLLSRQERTHLAKVFLDRIKGHGYTPMIYASKSYLYNQLEMEKMQDYDVWVAHYNGTNDPIKNPTDYRGIYQIWQYTSTGKFAGINGNVDLDVSYKNY